VRTRGDARERAGNSATIANDALFKEADLSLSEEVRQAAQNVIAASETTLCDELNRFIGRFVGVPFNVAPGSVRDRDGNQTGRFASVIHSRASGTGDAGVFPADSVAAVV